jgi:hypothetical protein
MEPTPVPTEYTTPAEPTPQVIQYNTPAQPTPTFTPDDGEIEERNIPELDI